MWQVVGELCIVIGLILGLVSFWIGMGWFVLALALVVAGVLLRRRQRDLDDRFSLFDIFE
jgi:hypothetical protein